MKGKIRELFLRPSKLFYSYFGLRVRINYYSLRVSHLFLKREIKVRRLVLGYARRVL